MSSRKRTQKSFVLQKVQPALLGLMDGAVSTLAPIFAAAGLTGKPEPLVATVGVDAFDKGKQAARATVEDQRNAVAILNVGGMNGNAQQEAERVDQDVPLSTRNLLARIVALRIERRPPF